MGGQNACFLVLRINLTDKPFLFFSDLVHRWQEHAADGVPSCHDENVKQRRLVDRPGGAEIVHVRNAVFKPGQDKDNNAQKNNHGTEQVWQFLAIAFNGDIHQQAAENREDKYARQRVPCFDGAQSRGGSGNLFQSRLTNQPADQKRPGEVAQPDGYQRYDVREKRRFGLVDQIADRAGIELELKAQDYKQSESEQGRARQPTANGQVDRPRYADGNTG